MKKESKGMEEIIQRAMVELNADERAGMAERLERAAARIRATLPQKLPVTFWDTKAGRLNN